MTEPLRPVTTSRPRPADAVRAVARVGERARRDPEDGRPRERDEDARREPPAATGPDADGHVDLLA